MSGSPTPVPVPYLSSQDQLTYWLLRLSESLSRLNDCLLWAGASPAEFGRLLSGAALAGSPLAADIAHASATMRRFADLMFVVPSAPGPEGRSIWEDLMDALRTLLSACGEQSELWLFGEEDTTINPVLVRELRATVYAVERLCGHFERVH